VACNIFHKFDKCKTLKIATSSFPKNLLRIYLFLIAQNISTAFAQPTTSYYIRDLFSLARYYLAAIC
jgi:hypothetical protein